jgi:regulation of enolase protein 1 (concanavalin A-like superfamily)
MDWYNEPAKWSVDDNAVIVESGPQTDFWRLTHGGYINDNGHFYFQSQVGDFVAEVKVSGSYNALYDQAGLMVRVDETNWVKCGIEVIDGVQHASAVITREYSDWSMVPLPHNPEALWLRVKRQGSTIEVHYALEGVHYQLLRQGYLSLAQTVQVGLMCAAPEGPGFPVTFEGWTLQKLDPSSTENATNSE